MNTNDIAFLLTAASFVLPSLSDGSSETANQIVAQAVSTLVDPPRVVKSRVGPIFTVRHANGQPLRGIAIGSYRYRREQGQSAHLRDPKYWAALRAAGVNAIRLVAFDAWQRSHGAPGTRTCYPHTNVYDPKQTQEMLAEFDLIVNQAAANGMVVMINYHDVGSYRDADYTVPAAPDGSFRRKSTILYVWRFWNVVAPRYANRSHVFYELLNEPVQWTASEVTAEDIKNFRVIFNAVRALAPKTHIVVCSFASHVSSGPRTMTSVALDMQKAGIDFSNASLGFHPYYGNTRAPNPSQPILELMQHVAVINTEQNFPTGIVPHSGDPSAPGLDGDRLGVQSMERLRISWFHWNVDTISEFDLLFRGVVIPDAKAKGYYWVK